MKTQAEKLEKEFDIFFESISYERIDKLLNSSSPTFNNCDYVNNKKQILVELKIIETDYFFNGGIIKSQNSIITKPINISENGEGFYEFSIKRNQNGDAVGNIEEPLKRLLKKANKQIKETKEHFNFDNYKGLIILALNYPTTINPLLIRQICFEHLEKDYSSINSLLIVTPKYGFKYENKYYPCTTFGFESESTEDSNFIKHINSISEKWLDFAHYGGHK